MKNINQFLTFVYITVGICICFMIYCVFRMENTVIQIDTATSTEYEYWVPEEFQSETAIIDTLSESKENVSYFDNARYFEDNSIQPNTSSREYASSNLNDIEAVLDSSHDENSSQPTSSKSANSKPAASKPETYTGIVNINTASLEQLCSLNGIGEVTAKKIIDFRNQAGGFNSIEEIMYVNGIGEKKFEAIKDRITV